jgi:predicted DNA-binding protein
MLEDGSMDSTSREEVQALMRSSTPLFMGTGDRDNPGIDLKQPMNIPAVIEKYVRGMDEDDGDRMRSFTMRISEDHHTRLVLLAEALATSKTTLARELLEIATREAVGSLPEDLQAEVRRKFLEAV